MPSQHIKVKNGNRGNGLKHSLYIGGDGQYGERDDVVFVDDGNLPKWASNADDFFAAADELERGDYTQRLKKKDGEIVERTVKGRAYKEIEAGVPRECEDPVQWAKDFAKDVVGDKHPYRLAVHDKEAQDGGRNVHLHLMFSTRTLDGHEREKDQFFSRAQTGSYRHRKTGELVAHDRSKGGAEKSKHWNSRESVPAVRSLFERHVQREVPGFKLQRSEAPEPKIGPKSPKAKGRTREATEYDKKREGRAKTVDELRGLKRDYAKVKDEVAREGLSTLKDNLRKHVSDGHKAPMQRLPEKAERPDWTRFRDVAGGAPQKDRTDIKERLPEGRGGRADDGKDIKSKFAEHSAKKTDQPGKGLEAERASAHASTAVTRLEKERDSPTDRDYGPPKPVDRDAERLREKLERQQQERAERSRERDDGFDIT